MSSMFEEGSDDRVVIFIDSRNGYRAKLAIKPNDKLDLLFKKYCNKLNLPVATMRFLMDGRRVEGRKTAGQLRTEVDELEGPGQEIVIQALEPLQGGGPGENEASGKRKVQKISRSIRVVSSVVAGNSKLGMSAKKKMKPELEMVKDVDVDSKPEFVWLTFVMPNGEEVPVKMSAEKTMLDACRTFCKKKKLDFRTVRFRRNNMRVVRCMLVWKVWMDYKQGEKIIINVRTKCLPHVKKEEQKLETPPEKDQKKYSSDKVTFSFKWDDVILSIEARQNQTMGFAFRTFAGRVSKLPGSYRFLWGGCRISEFQLVGEFKEEFDESEEGQEGEDIIIEVFAEQVGGGDHLTQLD